MSNRQRRRRGRNRKEPTKLSAGIFLGALALVLPLPFALYWAGTGWLTSGWKAVPTEFWLSYLFGLGVLVVIFFQGLRISRKEKAEKAAAPKPPTSPPAETENP